MSKLLIYIGEGIKFDLSETVRVITNIDGVTNSKSGDFIGAVFECDFADDGLIIRIRKGLETITIDGFIKDSANFIIKLQNNLSADLSVIDMDYSFDLKIRKFSSAGELLSAMEME